MGRGQLFPEWRSKALDSPSLLVHGDNGWWKSGVTARFFEFLAEPLKYLRALGCVSPEDDEVADAVIKNQVPGFRVHFRAGQPGHY